MCQCQRSLGATSLQQCGGADPAAASQLAQWLGGWLGNLNSSPFLGRSCLILITNHLILTSYCSKPTQEELIQPLQEHFRRLGVTHVLPRKLTA